MTETTENWRNTHARLVCLAFTDPPTSHNYWPEHDEWQEWAVQVHRSAVRKADSLRAVGPLYVSAWLAMRAASRGWEDLFNLWGEKAHSAGEVTKEALGSALFKKLGWALALEERIDIGWRRFRQEYEESFGYPLSCSPLVVESYAEER